MMGWTDRHFRYLLRLCSPTARLFTEMITAPALIHGPRDRMLAFNDSEHPVVLQIGGCEPLELAQATRLAAEKGFDEVNLNVGCPSPRVSAGRFGACLMLEPALVADCVRAMKDASDLPVTVKCRLGVDDADSNELLEAFVDQVLRAGCDALYLHARKAELRGLSPRQNREVPPLQPERVYRIKDRFPYLPVILNGGVADPATARRHLNRVDGVMIGRRAYQDPSFVARLDSELFGGKPLEHWSVLDRYGRYIDTQLDRGVRLNDMTRHMLGMLKGIRVCAPISAAVERHRTSAAQRCCPGSRSHRRRQASRRLKDKDKGPHRCSISYFRA